MKHLLALLFLCWTLVVFSQSTVTELRRYEAPNATQAVAADSLYFYTISNSKIIKRQKSNGEIVAEWSGGLKHLNSGIILDGKLYCANTNYPLLPMASSLEIFDTETLQHIGSHSFGIYIGSFTWIDEWEGDYYLMFVHYENYAQERDKGVAYTTLIRTDDQFRRKAGWTIPQTVVDHLKPTSISGGTFFEDGTMLLSPHHFEEVYIFDFPKMGYELEWTETIPVPFQGQGLAIDRTDGTIWGIHRNNREVIQVQLERSKIPGLVQKLKDPQSKEVLVVAHRGDWRNAPENSIQAIENSIKMGVDMVEIDVRMTKDGELVLMHDETVDRTTTGKGKVTELTLAELQQLYLRNGANHPTHHRIPTLEEAMLAAKGKVLINLDKCYDYFDKAYAVLEKTGTVDHVVMKGSVPLAQVQREFGAYLEKVLFMPIVNLDAPDAAQIIADYQAELKPVAFEVIFSDESSPLLNDFKQIRQNGSRIWVNTLWESLNAGYEDDRAVEDPDAVYGWLLKKGVTMLQTDRPAFLLDYLRNQGLHK